MKRTRFVFPVAFLVLLLWVLGTLSCQSRKEQKEIAGPEQLGKAADFQLRDLRGGEVRLSDFSGKVVILNFWATWCPPCRMELPGLQDLYARYKDRGATVVGIAVDSGGEEELKRFVRKVGIDYPVLVGDQKVMNQYGGIQGLPTTFIIDQNGIILNRYMGLVDLSIYEKSIRALLK